MRHLIAFGLCLFAVVLVHSASLYDQTDNEGTFGYTNIRLVLNQSTLQLADDFTVPATKRWAVSQINFSGFFNPLSDANQVQNWTIEIWSTGQGSSLFGSVQSPSIRIYSLTGPLTTGSSGNPSFNILPPYVLEPGLYWVSAYAWVLGTGAGVSTYYRWFAYMRNATTGGLRGHPFQYKDEKGLYIQNPQTYANLWIPSNDFSNTTFDNSQRDLNFQINGNEYDDDNTPPSLNGITFNPATVSFTSQSASVTLKISLSISDDYGFAEGSVVLSGPSNTYISLDIGPADRISGTAVNGMYSVQTVLTPSSTPVGTWNIVNITLTDIALPSSNQVILVHADLVGLGYTASFPVIMASGTTGGAGTGAGTSSSSVNNNGSKNSSSANVLAIVLGTLGGVLGVVLLVSLFVVIFIVAKRNNNNRGSQPPAVRDSEHYGVIAQPSSPQPVYIQPQPQQPPPGNYQQGGLYTPVQSNQPIPFSPQASQYGRSGSVEMSVIDSNNAPAQYGNIPVPYTPMQGTTTSSPSGLEIDVRELEFEKEIGSGAFGVVYKGKWRGGQVAIKKLSARGSMTATEMADFKREALVMKNLRPHVNVVQFLGITDSAEVCIVTEFMDRGSLYDFLRSDAKMDPNILMNFVTGICAGMLHLHREGLIHRDLAARNILLNSSYQVKISDFGLSRADSQNSDKGNQTKSDNGPLKWMAPEAIKHRTYSFASDVWAFGVTLYEIVAREDPYPALNPVQTALEVTHNGLRLNPPTFCPPLLGQIMKQCFATNPAERPDFDGINKALSAAKLEDWQFGGQSPSASQQSRNSYDTEYNSLTASDSSKNNKNDDNYASLKV